MSLGKTLKELRLSKKLNQSDLAKLLNIDRTTLKHFSRVAKTHKAL